MSSRFAAFQHAPYQRYFFSRFLSGFAAQVLSMSVAWQMYQETKSALMLGLIGLVQFAPALALVLFTGMAADRFGRRLVMLIAVTIELVIAGVILLMAVTGQFHPWVVLGLLTLFGASRAFFRPASQALVVNLVPSRDFANAVAWNSSSWQAASIIGPMAGGLLYGVSPVVAYGVAAAMFLGSTLFIAAIPAPAQRKSTERVSIEVLLGGFSYIAKQKIVLGAISLDLFAVLLGGAIAMMPVYAEDILKLGPFGLGMLRAAPGIGALVMVGVLTSYPIRTHAGLILFATTAAFGLATALFGISTLPWLSILSLMFVGASDMVSVYIRNTLIQLWTPDELRGRVNAVSGIFISASNELGEFRAGTMAALIGVVPAVTLGGVAAVGVSAIGAWLFPQLRKIQHLEAPEDETDEKTAQSAST